MLLKLLGSHFLMLLLRELQRKVYRCTGDNWNLKILKGHMRKEIQNEDLHLSVSFNHLPNDNPKGNLKKVSRNKFSLNVNELKRHAECAKILVGRIVLEFLPEFKFLKAVIPQHIPHKYSQQMSQKSTVVSLPIINMNEAKYKDCVTIIRTYEKWIAEIYVKAGKLDKVPVVDNQPAPHGSAAPGQRDAHRQDTVDTPLCEMKIVSIIYIRENIIEL